MSSTSAKLWGKWHYPADPTHISFAGKTVLVTGANSGLGYETALKYASLGASTLILGVWTEEKGNEARANIIRRTHCSADIFIIETVDLSNFASVKDFADRIIKRVAKLHVVQLVAGTVLPSYRKSPDGFEMTLQVNVLSTALMALQLLPKVEETATAISLHTGQNGDNGDFVPHISFLNSIASFEVQADWLPPEQSLIQRCDDESKWDTKKQYFLAKLALWFFIRGLAEQLAKDGQSDMIVVNATCPGVCKTNMARNFPLAARIVVQMMFFFMGRTAEEGARTLVRATGLGAESNGKLYRNDRLEPMSQFLESERGIALYHESWEEIMTILRTHVPSVKY